MKYKLFHMLDRYIGSIACWLFTLSVSKRSKKKPQPKRIVINCITEAGALVCAYPMIRYLKKEYPDAELYGVTSSVGIELFTLYGFSPKNVINISVVNTSIKDIFISTIRAVWQLRFKIKPDVALNLEAFVRFPLIVSYLSGAKYQVGFHPFRQEGNYIGNFLTHKLMYQSRYHISASYLGLAMSLNSPSSDSIQMKDALPTISDTDHFKFSPNATLCDDIRHRLKQACPLLSDTHKLIIINPNSSDRLIFPLRKWPDKYYVECMTTLLSHDDIIIIMTGLPHERADIDALTSSLSNSDRIINLAGKTSINELFNLYSMCDLLITNDSGPAHFAATTSLSSVVLYGPETPSIFGAMGRHVHHVYKNLSCSPCINVYNSKYSACTDNQCMQRIRPKEVYDVAIQRLYR